MIVGKNEEFLTIINTNIHGNNLLDITVKSIVLDCTNDCVKEKCLKEEIL